MKLSFTANLSGGRVSLLFFCLFCSLSNGWAQEETVQFPPREITAEEAVNIIEEQTPYVFVYDVLAFDGTRKISIDPNRASVRQAIARMINGRDLSYTQNDHYIVINPVQKEEIQAPDSISRTGDLYRLTDRNALSADPVVRPVAAQESAQQLIQVEEEPAPAPAPYYSAYTPVSSLPMLKPQLPRWAVKTNLLYDLAALTPNLSVEYGLNERSSVELSFAFNNWNRKAKLDSDNKKRMHWTIRPEYRYWFCERYSGHFVGANLSVSKYNIRGYDFFYAFDKEYRYEGYAYGAGFTYGYALPLGKRWNAEFNVGVGIAYLPYDRYDCTLCSRESQSFNKTYFGPTRLGIHLVYLIK